jgi:hypothetical protein
MAFGYASKFNNLSPVENYGVGPNGVALKRKKKASVARLSECAPSPPAAAIDALRHAHVRSLHRFHPASGRVRPYGRTQILT